MKFVCKKTLKNKLHVLTWVLLGQLMQLYVSMYEHLFFHEYAIRDVNKEK